MNKSYGEFYVLQLSCWGCVWLKSDDIIMSYFALSLTCSASRLGGSLNAMGV